MAEHYSTFLHSHALFWLVMLILFFLTIVFIKTGKAKAGKIMQMSLRLFYVFVLITGVALVIINGFHWTSIVKSILAIWLIYVMEFISTRSGKGTLVGTAKVAYWAQFIIALVLVLYFGYVVTG